MVAVAELVAYAALSVLGHLGASPAQPVPPPTEAAPTEAAATETAATERPAPEHVIAIYEYAAATAACPLDWTVLGGVGGVASDHTRVGSDPRLLPDGATTPLILYEPWDGGVAPPVVADSDAGAIDGDPALDTTIGPMQFLPSTWLAYGVDGNGDGIADPSNLWDAAAGAANLLCQLGVDRDVDAALTAYFGTDRHGAWLDRRIEELATWRTTQGWGPTPQPAQVVTIVPPDPTVVLPDLSVPPPDGAETTAPLGGVDDRIDVAGIEQTPSEFIGPVIPEPAQPDAAQPDAAQPDAAQPDPAQPDAAQPDAAQPESPPTVIVAPSSTSGDWIGDDTRGTAAVDVARDGASAGEHRIVVTDALGRPYGRAIPIDPLLADAALDPTKSPTLVAGDWDGDGVDTIAVVVRDEVDMASALILDRSGELDEQVAVGLLVPGAGVVAGEPTIAEPVEGTFWDERVIDDGTTIALWRVGGILVERSSADPLGRMLAAAAADGITLEGWGWRSNEAQIELRRAHCADVWTTPASLCNPPTAIPGTSRHEFGVAIDFHRAGQTIGASSAEFEWLVTNAERFGFFNLPSEPWHWSIDGG